jgi:hypothetical protein
MKALFILSFFAFVILCGIAVVALLTINSNYEIYDTTPPPSAPTEDEEFYNFKEAKYPDFKFPGNFVSELYTTYDIEQDDNNLN